MTCIIALKHDNGILVGADSLMTIGYECDVLKQKKIFKKGRYVIGITGRLRSSSLLIGADNPPEPKTKVTHNYMIQKFIPWLKKVMTDSGFQKKKDEVEEMVGTWLLVVVDGEIYTIDSDYSLYQNRLDFQADGSGAPYAKGSLFKSEGSPKERMKKALEAAEYFSAGVRRPFYYIDIKED